MQMSARTDEAKTHNTYANLICHYETSFPSLVVARMAVRTKNVFSLPKIVRQNFSTQRNPALSPPAKRPVERRGAGRRPTRGRSRLSIPIRSGHDGCRVSRVDAWELL